ncbi:hypothetical protein BDZ45DRAFT_692042 [Acephala macrosclerotiorum]|nr:hypothetical protein BDZ45DRAFT_692042 [Acephala macrosclerotiorum]
MTTSKSSPSSIILLKAKHPNAEIMFQTVEAYLNMPWVLASVSVLPMAHWLLERKPELVALFCPGEADSWSAEKFIIQSHSKKPTLQTEPSSNLPNLRSLAPGNQLHSQKERLVDAKTRSWRVPRKHRNRIPDAIYHKDDVAWLTVQGKLGAFKVTVDADGVWDSQAQQWKYAVRQTDDALYEGGKLVGEEDLNRNEK